MKKILPLFFILLFHQVHSQDTLYWSPCHKLMGKDFKAKADTLKTAGANSRIGVIYDYQVIGDSLSFQINTFFLRNLSWTKFSLPVVLDHEQVHFDISKFFALELEREFRRYKRTNNIASDLRNIYTKVLKKRDSLDTYFDSTIANSQIPGAYRQFVMALRKNLPQCPSK